MNELLKRYKIRILIFFIPYLLAIRVLTKTTEVQIITPGQINPIDEIIEIDTNNTQSGNFYSTSVSVNYEITLFMKWVSGFIETSDTYVYDQSSLTNFLTTDEIVLKSKLTKSIGIKESIIKAFEIAIDNGYAVSVDYTINNELIIVNKFISNNDLSVGDKIVKINDSTDFELELQNSYENKEAITIEHTDLFGLTETTVLEYNSQFKNYGLDLEKSITINKLYDDGKEIDYDINGTSIGGSSGELLQTLYIYNMITSKDISNGLNISGTGSISLEDTLVYEVSAIRQKIITSLANNVDIFFIPTENYIEAEATLNSYKDKYSSDMKIVSVESIEDAINYLEDKEYENN